MIGFSYEYFFNDAMCIVFINGNRAGSAFVFSHDEKIYSHSGNVQISVKPHLPGNT